MHPDVVYASGGFRLYVQFITSKKDQKTSLGAGVLDGRAHDSVDQFLQNHLARDCLRDFDYRSQIQEFARCQNCPRAAESGLLFLEVWVQMVELPHLAIGSPMQIAVAGITQIGICDLVETTP